ASSSKPRSQPRTVTLYSREIESPVIPQAKLRPVIGQPIVTPVSLPGKLIVSCAPCTTNRKCHLVQVFWSHAGSLHVKRSLRLDFCVWVRRQGGRAGQTPAARKCVFHNCGRKDAAWGAGRSGTGAVMVVMLLFKVVGLKVLF